MTLPGDLKLPARRAVLPGKEEFLFRCALLSPAYKAGLKGMRSRSPLNLYYNNGDIVMPAFPDGCLYQLVGCRLR